MKGPHQRDVLSRKKRRLEAELDVVRHSAAEARVLAKHGPKVIDGSLMADVVLDKCLLGLDRDADCMQQITQDECSGVRCTEDTPPALRLQRFDRPVYDFAQSLRDDVLLDGLRESLAQGPRTLEQKRLQTGRQALPKKTVEDLGLRGRLLRVARR